MSEYEIKDYPNARALFPFFQTIEGENAVYFDHAAMGLLAEPIAEQIRQFQFTPFGKKRLPSLISSIATSYQIPKETIYPNMGAHMAFERIVQYLDRGKFCRFLIDPLSHKAITNPLDSLVSRDRGNYQYLALNEDFSIDTSSLLKSLSKDTSAVVVNQISNVHGHEQDIESLYRLIEQFNLENQTKILFIVDGSQAPSRLALKAPNCDIYFFAQQKCFSMPGAVSFINDQAAKVLSQKDEVKEARHFLDEFFMAGTPHFLSILSLAKTLEFLRDLDDGMYLRDFDRKEQLENLTRHCYERIQNLPSSQILADHSRFLNTNRGILSFTLKGFDQSAISNELAQFGMYIRCASKDSFNHFFCVPNSQSIFNQLEECNGALRISLQWMNTIEELDKFFTLIEKVSKRHVKTV